MTPQHINVPTSEPGLFVDPNSKTALADLRENVVQYCMWQIASEFAVEKEIEYTEYVSKLTSEERTKLHDMAYARALEVLDKTEDLVERTTMSVAYRVMRRNIHKALCESDSLEEFLLEKLETTRSTSSINEAVFLLQLLETFELNDHPGYADKIFNNRVSYRKLVASIPYLRTRRNRLLGAKSTINETIGELDGKKAEVRKELAETQDKTAREELRKELDELETQAASVKHRGVKEEERLMTDLRVSTNSAFELAASSMDHSQIASALPILTRENLKKEGLKPEEISPDYSDDRKFDGNKSKPIALMANLKGAVVFTFSVKAKYAVMVQRMLETVFDVSISDLDECADLINSHREKKGKKS